jgi:RNA polymerase sigma-70 factor (ECF subfamily)
MKMTGTSATIWERRGNVVSSVIDPDALRGTGDPHDDLHSEEQKKMLYKALQELPEKERAAVVLRDIEGFSTAEVAGILGSSEATVRSQISTARLKIRKAVKWGRV